MALNLLNWQNPNPQMTGLLGPYYDPAEARKQALWGALTQAGLGLLSQGPSKTPIGFGDTLAAGFKGGLEGAQQGQQNYMQQGLLAKQMADAEADRQRQLKADARLNTEFGWKVEDHGHQEDAYAAQQRWLQSLPPEQRSIAEGNPDAYYQQYLQTQFPQSADGFTLSEGQTRYDGQGKPIVTAPNPQAGPGGALFDSKSIEGQALNYLVQTGQLTKDQAAQIAAGKPIAGADGSMHFLTPQDIVGAAQRAGSLGGGQATQTENTGQTQQAGIPLGPAKKTEAQIKGEAIEAGATTSFDTAVQGFDALASVWGSAAERIPGGMGRVFQSGEYQKARDAVKNVVANYIYALSGQQAPESEVERQVNITLPGPFDKPEAIAGKKARLIGMIETIKSRAQGPGGNVPQQGQPQQINPGTPDVTTMSDEQLEAIINGP